MSILAKTQGTATKSSSSVRLRDRFDIRYDRSMPQFQSSPASVFAATDLQSPTAGPLMAFICDPRQPPRLDMVRKMKRLKNGGGLTIVDDGSVDWAPNNRRQYVIIAECPPGGRLTDSATSPLERWPEDRIITQIIAPLLLSLAELEREGLTHRNIRPNNIFFRDAGRRMAMLGDCVTSVPALYQPIVYETIESGLTDPLGRGNGSIAADLYSLGVLALHLALGKLPLADKSPADVLEAKIKRGSFFALVDEFGVPDGLQDLLRGLLIDETSARWRVQDVHLWLDGRRLTAKPPPLAVRANRALDIGSESCTSPRHAAWALHKQGEEGAARAIRGPGFETWITRSLNEKSVTDGVGAAMTARADGPGGGNQASLFVSRILIALDPPAPIRYRSLTVAADGLGGVLAAAMQGQGDAMPIAEMILARLPAFWALRQLPARVEDNLLARFFERQRRTLEDQRPGHGLERVAYELAPGLHCLSPPIEQRHVMAAGHMLQALETATASGEIDAWPIDRHVAAFLAMREPNFDEGLLFDIANPDQGLRILATLKLLAYLQENYGPAITPGLIQLFAGRCKAVIDRFHNRHTRAKMEAGLAAIIKESDLGKLYKYLDNEEEQRRDEIKFQKARNEYQQILKKLDRCDKQMEELDIMSQVAGRNFSVRIASLFGIIITVGSFFALGVM